MIFHFRDKFPQLNAYLDKYSDRQKRLEVPAKTILLKEGERARHYIYIEKGCIRAFLNSKGIDKTVQFFFENEGLTSLESFLKNTPSFFTLETIEPSIIHLMLKLEVDILMNELNGEPEFLPALLKISAERQLHYMNEFVSFIRDTPEERYQNLLNKRPYIIKRVPQHYIASYLGISRVHLSRIKANLARKK